MSSAPDTVFEFSVDSSNPSYEWSHWGSKIPGWTYEGPNANMSVGQNLSNDFATLLIPTIDSVRTEYNMDLSISATRPTLLVGGPGTAKTSIILQVLGKQDASTTAIKKLSFSSATTPSLYQRSIEGSVEKRQGKTFGPPGGKRMCVFIDDISMPLINDWGDQITLEIVRQLIEQGGLYSLDKPGDMKLIIDLLFFGAMLHPGGGKNDIPNRAKRHFHVMNVTLPSAASINQIFGSMISAKFSPSDPDKNAAVWEAAGKLVELTIDIWDKTKTKMLPTPAKFHYIFNLRDLSRVFQGVFQCDTHDTIKSDVFLLQLWKHECQRVFSDRLVDHKDKQWFNSTIDGMLENTFGATGTEAKATAYFIDYLREGYVDPETDEVGPAPKVYEMVPSLDEVKRLTTEYMGKFNENFKLLAARRRGRLGQAVAHAAGLVHRPVDLLPDHHHQAVQRGQPALPPRRRAGQARRVAHDRQGGQGGGLPRVHQHLPQHGRAAQPLRARRVRHHHRRDRPRLREYLQGLGADAGRPLGLLHHPRARQPPPLALLLARRAQVPHARQPPPL